MPALPLELKSGLETWGLGILHLFMQLGVPEKRDRGRAGENFCTRKENVKDNKTS